MLPPESRNEAQAQNLLSTPRPSSSPQVMNIVVSCPNLSKIPPPSLRITLVLFTPHPLGVENVPTRIPSHCTAHMNVHTTRIIPTTPPPAITPNQMHLLFRRSARTPHQRSQRIKGVSIGVPIQLSPSALCVRVVILVHVRGVLSIVVPPLFRHTRECPVALHVRTPDSVHHAWSALLYLVTLISKLYRPALSTLKLHRSWTNGCVSSLRRCQLFRLTAPLSTLTLPYPTLLPVLHLGHPVVAEEVVGASQGFAFALESVSAAMARGAGKATLSTLLSTPPVRCPILGWTMGGRFRLVISLGSLPNLGSPRTGLLTGRWFPVSTEQETLIGAYNHPFQHLRQACRAQKDSYPPFFLLVNRWTAETSQTIFLFCYYSPSPSV